MKHQRGVTLIESMVALLVLTLAVLGATAMQIRVTQFNRSALQRSQTTVLAYYLMDAMRANAKAARAGEYNHALFCRPIPGNSLAQRDLREWYLALRRDLGDAESTCGAVACDDQGQCAVTIQWAEHPQRRPYILTIRSLL